VATALAVLGMPGIACAPDGPPQHVVMIVVDTLRADVLGLYGDARGASPRIDALGGQSIVFERAFAQGTYTPASYLSYMTSTWVRRHGFDYHVAVYPESGVCGWTDLDPLPEVLARSGFVTEAFVANFRLGPKGGFARGFARWNDTPLDGPPPADERARSQGLLFGDRQVVESAARSFGQWRPGERRFLYLHLMAPHLPLAPSRAAREAMELTPDWAPRGRINVIDIRRLKQESTPDQRAATREGYLASVRDGDRAVGRILDALDASGHADDTIVVLLADHGEQLWEHGDYGHDLGVWQQLAHVPLVLRIPGREPMRMDDRAVGLLDLAPTLLALLGIEERPASWQGRDLFAAPEARPVFTERLDAVAVTRDGRHRVTGVPGTGLGWSAFDLETDPAEQDPLPLRSRGHALVARYATWDAEVRPVERDPDGPAVGRCRDVTEQDRREYEDALRALGYVE
jgi:arylsulfatase A-like enzyme